MIKLLIVETHFLINIGNVRMTPKEVKTFLENNNLTEEQMTELWEYCASFPEFGGGIVEQLRRQGLRWQELNYLAAKSLITLQKSIEEKVINSILNINNSDGKTN